MTIRHSNIKNTFGLLVLISCSLFAIFLIRSIEKSVPVYDVSFSNIEKP